jgi:NADPH-dependent curcumin reductase CurA
VTLTVDNRLSTNPSVVQYQQDEHQPKEERMTDTNRKWVLAERPTGLVGPEHFEWREEPIPAIGDGEFLIRNLWLSCDPAQRTYMEFDSYIPKIPIGEVMISGSAGKVVASNHPDFEVGDMVSGAFGWQDYAVSDGSPLGGLIPPVKIPDGVDAPTAMSLFGITGLTAYFGLLDVAAAKPGETVVVSAAAGAVGSTVCQIAKIKGCRVIGIAGGPQKCQWVREGLGADDAIDYKNDDVAARLAETCPDGVDVFFDNVGGPVLDAVLENLALRGRIALCGTVSGYDGQWRGINTFPLQWKRGTMRGFLIFDYLDRATEAVSDLAQWIGEGKITNRVDIMEGLENAPMALRRLSTGENVGKQLVKIADD